MPLALIPLLLTFVIQSIGWDLFRPFAWFLFVPAVAMAAWIGGLRVGVLATVIATALVWWYFLPPERTFVKELRLTIPTAVFMTTGAMIAAIVDRLTRATAQLRRVSDERRNFAALVESAHERLRSLFESAPDGIFIADLEGHYTNVNVAGCQIVGYSREELIGMSILDLVRPEDAERLERDKAQLLAGHAVVGEWLLRRKDGTLVAVEVGAKILSDGRWQGFVRDNTSRKQLEQALSAKSADLDRAQSVAQIGSWRLDIQRNELRWSDEAYRIFGVPIGTSLTYERFLDCVHPDDRAYVDRMWTAALGGAPYDIDHRLLVDGRIKWVREKADLEFDDRGALLGGIGITQDITERKRLEAQVRQAQKRIELALNGADLAAWDWNIETGEVHFTARWAEMRGYSGDDRGQDVERWNVGIHPDDLARFQQALDDYFAGRTSEYECEFRVQTKSGSWIWVLDRGKVFARNAQGQPIRMLGTVLDVTTRKQAELERARLYTVAQRAIHARDDVLGIVAHDLRNPLNSIELLAQLLREGGVHERKAGDSIQRGVARMKRLILDMLDLTQLEAGQLAVERRRISTIQALHDVVDAQRGIVTAKGLALMVDIAPDLPEVCADRDRLLQICENLIGNALKFTQHGSVTVGAAPGDDEVLVWVKDTGSGIRAEALPHLFDRFWRAGKDRRNGAGLGLAIVKGLVEAHRGRIWVESTLGSGTCFYFTIPKVSADDAWSPPQERLASAP